MFKSGLYKKVPARQRTARAGEPPISVRWVDISKGGEGNHNYRSRPVAMEIKRDKRKGSKMESPLGNTWERIIGTC